jgi:hypothetical protein
VLLRGNPHAFDQRHGLVREQHLPFVMMRNPGQIVVHQLDAAAIEERPIARYRHEHGPTAVIRNSDDAVR